MNRNNWRLDKKSTWPECNAGGELSHRMWVSLCQVCHHSPDVMFLRGNQVGLVHALPPESSQGDAGISKPMRVQKAIYPQLLVHDPYTEITQLFITSALRKSATAFIRLACVVTSSLKQLKFSSVRWPTPIVWEISSVKLVFFYHLWTIVIERPRRGHYLRLDMVAIYVQLKGMWFSSRCVVGQKVGAKCMLSVICCWPGRRIKAKCQWSARCGHGNRHWYYRCLYVGLRGRIVDGVGAWRIRVVNCGAIRPRGGRAHRGSSDASLLVLYEVLQCSTVSAIGTGHLPYQLCILGKIFNYPERRQNIVHRLLSVPLCHTRCETTNSSVHPVIHLPESHDQICMLILEEVDISLRDCPLLISLLLSGPS